MADNEEKEEIQTADEQNVRLKVTELEKIISGKDAEMLALRGRFSELEKSLTVRDNEIASLKQARVELENSVTETHKALSRAIASYREMVIQSSPEVVSEMIIGETIESINESLSRAKSLVNKVRQGLEAEISLARFPAGAPERSQPDLSGLSAREKIQYGISSSGNR